MTFKAWNIGTRVNKKQPIDQIWATIYCYKYRCRGTHHTHLIACSLIAYGYFSTMPDGGLVAKSCLLFETPLVQSVQNLPAMQEMKGSISRWTRSTAGGNGYPLQYSCPENSMDRGAWWATIHVGQRVGHNCMTYTLSHFFFLTNWATTMPLTCKIPNIHYTVFQREDSVTLIT